MDVVTAMEREFDEQPDRVIAIVGAAYLDSTLDSLLRAVLTGPSSEDVDKLLGPTGALGANGTRCQLAYCLGLITSDQKDDLRKIAKIRNKFAHDFNETTFNSSPIRDFCSSLKSATQLPELPSQLSSSAVAEQLTEFLKEEMPSTPREQFRTSVIDLFGSLLRRIHYMRSGPHKWYSYDPDALRGPSD